MLQATIVRMSRGGAMHKKCCGSWPNNHAALILVSQCAKPRESKYSRKQKLHPLYQLNCRRLQTLKDHSVKSFFHRLLARSESQSLEPGLRCPTTNSMNSMNIMTSMTSMKSMNSKSNQQTPVEHLRAAIRSIAVVMQCRLEVHDLTLQSIHRSNQDLSNPHLVLAYTCGIAITTSKDCGLRSHCCQNSMRSVQRHSCLWARGFVQEKHGQTLCMHSLSNAALQDLQAAARTEPSPPSCLKPSSFNAFARFVTSMPSKEGTC